MVNLRSTPLHAAVRAVLNGLRVAPSRRPTRLRTPVVFEPLEPRLLLSADPLTYVAADAELDLTIRLLEETAGAVVQLVDNEADTVVGERLLADAPTLEIIGSDAADRVRVEVDLGLAADEVGALLDASFDGQGGEDLLLGPANDSVWTLHDIDAGDLNGWLRFTGVERLVGAAENEDTFVFGPGAQSTGGVDGGDRGFDTLVAEGDHHRVDYAASAPDAGTLTLDDQAIRFAGLEPVDLPGVVAELVLDLSALDTRIGPILTVSDDTASLGGRAGVPGQLAFAGDTFETMRFANPTERLEIRLGAGDDQLILNELDPAFSADLAVTGGAGDDSVTVVGDLMTAGGYISIDAEMIRVEGATVSTLDGDAQAGDIRLVGRTIELTDGAALLAEGEDGSGGDIHIGVRDVARSTASALELGQRNVGVDVGAATLRGADIRIDAEAGDVAAGPVGFDGAADVNAATGAMDLGLAHGFIAGTPLIYRPGDAEPLAGLEAGKTYYAVTDPLNEQRLWLAASPEQAVIRDTLAVTPATAPGEHRLEPQGLPADEFVPAILDRILDDFLSVPAALGIKEAAAGIDIRSGADIAGSGDVHISALANADATVQAISGGLSGLVPVARAFSVAYSDARADATATVAGDVSAGGSLLLLAEANATADALARTSRNLGTTAPTDKDALAFALAIARSDTSARVELAAGGSLSAGRDVLVHADGDSTNKASAETGTYEDGLAGVTLALGFADSDIQSRVAGDVTAAGGPDSDKLAFRPPALSGEPASVSDVDVEADNIDVGVGHGLLTGDALRYGREQTTDIGGLSADTLYYAIVDEPDSGTIRLASSRDEALAGESVDLDSQPLLNPLTLTTRDAEHFLTPISGVSIDAELNVEELAAGVSQTRGDPLVKDALLKGEVTPVLPAIIGGVTGPLRDAARGTDTLNDTDYSLAGSGVYTGSDHQVFAGVGATAVVRSGTDMSVRADITHRAQTVAESTVSQRGDKFKDDAFSVAISVGTYRDTAMARIDGTVDAADTVQVKAQISYPFLTDPRALFTEDDFASPTAVGTLLDQKLGLQSKLFNSWTRAVGDGSDIGLAGSGNYMAFTNSARAVIGDGARVNQGDDPAFGGTEQHVVLDAGVDMQLVDMAGVFDLNFQVSNAQDILAKTDPLNTLNPMGAAGAKGGLGAGVLLLGLDNTAEALIAGDARVDAAGVDLDANTRITNVMLAQSGASAGRFGVSGTFSRLDGRAVTQAQVADTARVRADTLSVKALDDSTHSNLVGGVIKAKATGVGVSIGINELSRRTEAGIGAGTADAPGDAAGGGLELAGALELEAENRGRINAFVLAAAIVSDRPERTQEVNPLDGSPPPSPAEKRPIYRTGTGIAGAVGFNTISDTTEAYINSNGEVRAGSVSVSVENPSEVLAASGSAAINLGGTNARTSNSIAGAFSWNQLDMTTRALVRGAQVHVAGDDDPDEPAFALGAGRTGSLLALSAGGAGTTGKAQRGTAVAGSVSINQLINTTEAVLDGVTLTMTSADTVQVSARDASGIFAVGGGIAGVAGPKKGSGVGAAIGINRIDSTARAVILDDAGAARLGTGAAPIGALTVSAENNNRLESIGVSVGGAADFAAAGTLSVNLIHGSVEAAIEGATVRAAGEVSVTARDDSVLHSIAGALGLSLRKLGFGAAIAWNQVDTRVLARVDGADIGAGSLAVRAEHSDEDDTADGKILSATIGAAAAKETALAGSVSINLLSADIDARVGTGSSVATTGDIAVQATDDSAIRALAGGLAFSPGAGAFGAAVGMNIIDNNLDAQASSAVLHASGNVLIQAVQAGAIDALAMGLAGGKDFALGGSVVSSGIDTDTRAAVQGSVVDAEGSVVIAADNAATALTIAGAVGAAKSAGVGIASSTLITDNSSRARVSGDSRIRARGQGDAVSIPTETLDGNRERVTEAMRGLAVVATASEDLTNIAVAGAGAKDAAVAGSVPVTVVNQAVIAEIADGARINDYSDLPSGDNATAAHFDQRVALLAADDTRVLGVAGALAGAATAGVGVGVDVGVIDKETQARLDADLVQARGHVLVEAYAREDITSVSASLGGGGRAGVGGAVSTYTLTLTTRAAIGAGSRVTADGSIVVAADDATEVDMLAGNAAIGGSAGVGASAGVVVINKTTEATVGTGAELTARGLRGGLAAPTGGFSRDTLAETTSLDPPTLDVDDEGRPTNRAELEVRAPGSPLPAGADLHPDTSADAVNDPLLGGRRTVTRGIDPGFSGIAVTATNRDDIESLTVSLGASGGVSVSVGGGVAVVDADTRARIGADAAATADNGGAAGAPSLRIAAASDTYRLSAVGSLTAGTVAVTPGADVVVITNSTEAVAADGAVLSAEGDIAIVADAQEDLLALSAGVAVAGTGAVAGSAAVVVIDNATRASLGEDDPALLADDGRGATASAGGNVRIAADDHTDLTLLVGNLGADFGSVGAGVSVAVVTITKDTRAYVGQHSSVDAAALGSDTFNVAEALDADGDVVRIGAQRGLSVAATGSETLFSVAAAAAGGLYAGLAGGVTVQVLDADTLAYIGAQARVNEAGGGPAQSVSVTAVNQVRSFSFAGGLAGGAAGFGGGVDVGVLRNDSNAFIGAGARVAAMDDVRVRALSARDVVSVGVSAAAGGGAVAGSVSVWAIGALLDNDATTYSIAQRDDEGRARSPEQTNALDRDRLAVSTNGADGQADAFGDTLGAYSDAVAFERSAVDADADALALGDHGFSDGQEVTYSAGGGTPIEGLEDGGRYFVVLRDDGRLALAASRTDAAAGLAVDLGSGGAASGHRLDSVLGTATDGQQDRVGAASPAGDTERATTATDAATVGSGTLASIAAGAQVTAGAALSVHAATDMDLLSLTGSASIGGVAAGGAVGILLSGDDTSAAIDGSVAAGSGFDGEVRVAAGLSQDMDGIALAAAAAPGAGALSGQVVVIRDDSSQQARLGDGAAVTRAGGGVAVTATADRTLSADALGGALSLGGAAGVAAAVIDVGGSTRAVVGNADIGQAPGQSVAEVSVTAGSEAELDADAKALAGGLALPGTPPLGLTGSFAMARFAPTVEAGVLDGARIAGDGDVLIRAASAGRVTADAFGIGAAGVGIGLAGSLAMAESRPTLRAHIGAAAVLAAGSIQVEASHNETFGDTTRASATAGAGGLVGGAAGAVALATAGAQLDADVAAGASLNGQGIVVAGTAENAADADTTGIGGGIIGVGIGWAEARVQGATRAELAGTAQAGAGGARVAATADNRADADVQAVGGGVAGGTLNAAKALVGQSIRAWIADGSRVETTGDVTMEAVSTADADAETDGVAAGGLAIGTSLAEAVVEPAVTVGIGAAFVRAGDIRVRGLHNFSGSSPQAGLGASARGNASGGGLLSGNGADIDAAARALVDAELGGANADMAATGGIEVTARAHNDADALADGDTFGVVGIGVMLADAATGGGAGADIGGGSRLAAAGSLSVEAFASSTADARAEAVAGGALGAATGNRARSSVTASSNAGVGAGADVSVGSGEILALSRTDTRSDAQGVAAGAASVGASIANATETLDVGVALGINSRLAATGALRIAALHNTSLAGSPITANLVRANSNASAGGLVGGTGSDARAASSGVVDVLAGAGSVIDAGAGLKLEARASTIIDADGSGKAGGIAAGGIVIVRADAAVSSRVELGAGADLQAGGNLTLLADSRQRADAQARGGVGGALAGASTSATATITDATRVSIGADALVTARNGTLRIVADASLGADADAEITTGGAVTFNGTDATTDVDANTTVSVGADAALRAEHTELLADVSWLNARARAFSKTFAADSTSDSDSVLRVDSRTMVDVATGADIIGVKTLDLISRQHNVDTDSDATARIDAGVTGVVRADTRNDLDLDADITTAAGSALRSEVLSIHAFAPGDSGIYGRSADAEAGTIVQTVVEYVEVVKEVTKNIPVIGWIVEKVTEVVKVVTEVVLHSDESEAYRGAFNSDNSVRLDGDMFLGAAAGVRLTVNADGSIDSDGDISARIEDGQVRVDDVVSDLTGRLVVFSPTGSISGAGTIFKGNVLDRVEIVNHSDLDLVINDILPINPDVDDPSIRYTAAAAPDFAIAGVADATPQVRVAAEGAGDVIFAGAVRNSGGELHVTTAAGDVRTAADALVQANRAALDAGGDLGRADERLQLSLFRDLDRGWLDADAAGEAWLAIQLAEIRDNGIEDPLDGAELNVVAGGRLDLLADAAISYALGTDPNDPLAPVGVTGIYRLGDLAGTEVDLDIRGEALLTGSIAATGSARVIGTGGLLGAGGSIDGAAATLDFAGVVGTGAQRVGAGVGELAVAAGSAGIAINHRGDLVVGDLGGSAGLTTGGAIDVSAAGSLTINADTTGASVRLLSLDGSGSGNDLAVAARIAALSGGLTLAAGDLLDLRDGSLLNAAGSVLLGLESAGAGNADAGGGALILGGTVRGASLTLSGGPDNDSFSLRRVGADGLTLDAGAGNDEVLVGTGLPGSVVGPLDLRAGAGAADRIELDLTATAADQSGVLTASRFSGFGLGGIDYAGVEAMVLRLGSGSDTLRVESTSAATQVFGGAGAEQFLVSGSGDTAPAIDGLLTLDGQGQPAGAGDRLLWSAANAADALAGSLSATAIRGLGMGAGIDYRGLEDLSLTLGPVGEQFAVLGTAAGTATSVQAAAGPDQVTVGPALEAVQGPLRIEGGDDIGDLLRLDDTASTDQAPGTLAAGALRGFGMGAEVHWNGFTALEMSLGADPDTLLIEDTDVPTGIDTGDGSDTVTVETLSHASTLTLGAGFDDLTLLHNNAPLSVQAGSGQDRLSVLGTGAPVDVDLGADDDRLTIESAGDALLVSGGAGAGDRIIVDRRLVTDADSGALTDGAVPGQWQLTGLTEGIIDFSLVEQLDLLLGSNSDALTLASTQAGMAVNVFGNAGDDQVLVTAVGDATDVVGGDGIDTLTLDIDEDPAGRTELADRLTLDTEHLAVDNRDYAGAVAWVATRDELRAGGNLLLRIPDVDELEVLGGDHPDNSLEVTEPEDLDAIASLDGNRIELIAGQRVVQSDRFVTFNNYRSMDFEGLVTGSEVYRESRLKLSSGGSLTRVDLGSAAATAGDPAETLTLSLDGGVPFEMRSLVLQAPGGAEDVTFTGQLFDGGTVTRTLSVGSEPTRIDFPDTFERLATLSWTAGGTVVDDIVASPLAVTSVVEAGSSPFTLSMNVGLSTSVYREDGMELRVANGTFTTLQGYAVASNIIELRAIDRGTFTLLRMDVANLLGLFQQETTLTGFKADGSTVSQRVELEASFPSATVRRLSFGTLFEDVVRVRWAPPTLFGHDNLVIERADDRITFGTLAGGAASYAEDGMELVSLNGAELLPLEADPGPEYTADPALWPSLHADTFELRMQDGSAFGLWSMDVQGAIVSWPLAYTPPETLTFTGQRVDGSSVSQSFRVADYDANDFPADPQRVNFTSDFTDLLWVRWQPFWTATDNIEFRRIDYIAGAPLDPPPTEARITGLDDVALSPDGNQLYAVSSAQDALVVINASDLSERQLLKDGQDGVDGLDGAVAVRVSPDGRHVYVWGAADGRLGIFARDSADGSLEFIDTFQLPGGDPGIPAMTLSADGSLLLAESARYTESGVRIVGDGLLTEFFVTGGPIRDFPNFDALVPVKTRVDTELYTLNTDDFRPFDPDVQAENFAARYTGKIEVAAPSESGQVPQPVDVTFFLGSDDGSRLFINDALVVDNGGTHDFITKSGTVRLLPGLHDIRVEYFEATQASSIRLEWQMDGPRTRLSTGPALDTEPSILVLGRDGETGALDLDFAPPIDQPHGVALDSLDSWADLAVAPASAQNTPPSLFAVGGNVLAVFDNEGSILAPHFVADDLDGARALSVSADGRHVYVLERASLRVYSADGVGGYTLTQTLAGGGNAVRGLAGASDLALSPDGAFLFATGTDSNALTVFGRDAGDGSLTFLQLFLNNNSGSLGLEAPSGVVATADSSVYVSSAAGRGVDGVGGLARFVPTADPNAPDHLGVTFQGMGSVTIRTAGGTDSIEVLASATRDGHAGGVSTTIATGDGPDLVTLSALGGSTTVTTGAGDDQVELAAGDAGITLDLDLGSGDDRARLGRSGANAELHLRGGEGEDSFTVEGANLHPSSAATDPLLRIDGGQPDGGGDRLLFVATGADISEDSLRADAADVTPPAGLLGAQDAQGNGLGVVAYNGVETVEVLAAPDAEIAGPFAIAEGESVTFSSAGSRDFGRSVTYTWDLDGDGLFGDVLGPNPTLSWSRLRALGIDDDGRYNIALRLTNDLGLSNDAFSGVDVTNTPPQPVVDAPAEVSEGADFTIDLGLLVPDPGDDVLNRWEIDLGDGTTRTLAGGATSLRHRYIDDGTYTIRATAVDEDTAVTVTRDIAVLDVAPILVVTHGDSVPEAAPWRLKVSAVDPGDDAIQSWTVDWGDGNQQTFGSSQTLSLSHVYADDGNYNVVVTAVDEEARTAAANRTARITNQAPVLNLDGAARVDEGATYRLDLDATDPGADSIDQWRIEWGDGTQSVLGGDTTFAEHVFADDSAGADLQVLVTAQDEDGSYDRTLGVAVDNVDPTLIFAGAENVEEGSPYSLGLSVTDPGADTIERWVVDWGDGLVETFAGPVQDLSHSFADDGSYVITVSAEDEDGLVTAGRAVNVLDVAPSVQVSAPGPVAEGSPVTLSLAATDPGADQVQSWTLDWGDGSLETIAASAGGAATEASHVYADDSSYQVQVTGTDEDGVSAVAGVTVPVEDVAPTLVLSPVGELLEGAGFTLAMSAVDPGDDPILNWYLDWGDGSPVQTIPGERVQVPGIGADGNPTVTERDTVTARHVYADDSRDEAGGAYTLTVTAENADGSFVTTADIQVANVSPRLPLSGPASVAEGSPYVLQLGTVTDPGDDRLTGGLTVDWGDGTLEQFDTLPDSLTHIFADDGLYTLALSLEDEDGVHPVSTIAYVAEGTDEDGAQVLEGDQILVLDVAPTLRLDGAERVDEGETYTLMLTAEDPGADTIDAWVVEWGDGSPQQRLSGAAVSATHVFAQPGEQRIEVTAESDGDRYQAGKSIVVDAIDPIIGPLSLDRSQISEGETVTVSGSISDPSLDRPDAALTGMAVWSDGITTALNIDPNGGAFTTERTFLDDTPSGTDTDAFTVSITLTDADGGSALATSAPVTVANVAPTVTDFSLSDSTLDEGDTLVVRGSFTDPALGEPSETFTGIAVWSDGVETAVSIDSASGQFVTERRFEDDASSADADADAEPGRRDFHVEIRITDDDGGEGTGRSPAATVVNLAPAITDITLDSASIEEGQTAVLRGTFTDAALGAVGEQFTATALWSDGVETAVSVDAATGELVASRSFADDLDEPLTVAVTLTDDDGGSVTAVSDRLTVTDVAPSLAVDGARTVEAQSVYTLTLGEVVDPGDDTVATYRVDWGDGQVVEYADPSAITHVYERTGTRVIQVSVINEDGEHSVGSLDIEVTPAPGPSWETLPEDAVRVQQTQGIFDRRSRSFLSRVTIANPADQDLTGPLRVVIEDANKQVQGGDGLTDAGEAYFLIDDPDTLFGSGEELQLDLLFSGGRGRLQYNVRIERLEPEVGAVDLGADQVFDPVTGSWSDAEDSHVDPIRYFDARTGAWTQAAGV